MFFFFTVTPHPDSYTLSLHDALPISRALSARRRPPRPASASPTRADGGRGRRGSRSRRAAAPSRRPACHAPRPPRSEEHTSELQSQLNLVCRLLLVKNNNWYWTVLFY